MAILEQTYGLDKFLLIFDRKPAPVILIILGFECHIVSLKNVFLEMILHLGHEIIIACELDLHLLDLSPISSEFDACLSSNKILHLLSNIK